MPARLVLALLLLASPALASEWTVAADGSGDFTDLQAAIDASAPGDTLFVKGAQVTGVEPFVVTKSLKIRSRGGHGRIQGDGSNQDSDATALVIDAGAAADVAIADLTILGGDHESYGMNGADGIRVLSCGRLVVSGCAVAGGDMFIRDPFYGDSHGDTQEGIEVWSCKSLVLRDSTVRGGRGCRAWGYGPPGISSTIWPSVGGAAVSLGGAARAVVERSDLRGGDGGGSVMYYSLADFVVALANGYVSYPDTWIQGPDGGDALEVGSCKDALVIAGSRVAGNRGRYLLNVVLPGVWATPQDTWIGGLFFSPGQDGVAIDGRVQLVMR